MKHALLLAALLALAACGFQPVHSKSYRAQQAIDLSAVSVRVDNTRLGQLLKAEIEQGTNPDYTRDSRVYTLAITLTERDIYLFVNPDGTAGRGDVEFRSEYRLLRNSDQKVLQTGTISRVSSYNISNSADYATYVSEEDARKRGIIELGQDYKLRLSNLLGRVKPEDEKDE
jgi:LPS-assembly lipoprotein